MGETVELDALIEQLQKLKKSSRSGRDVGRMPVVLTPMGGLCNLEVGITSACLGFDWHTDRVVLHTKRPLMLWKSRREREEEAEAVRKALDSE